MSPWSRTRYSKAGDGRSTRGVIRRRGATGDESQGEPESETECDRRRAAHRQASRSEQVSGQRDAYELGDYRRWLDDAGYGPVQTRELDELPTTVVLAGG